MWGKCPSTQNCFFIPKFSLGNGKGVGKRQLLGAGAPWGQQENPQTAPAGFLAPGIRGRGGAQDPKIRPLKSCIWGLRTVGKEKGAKKGEKKGEKGTRLLSQLREAEAEHPPGGFGSCLPCSPHKRASSIFNTHPLLLFLLGSAWKKGLLLQAAPSPPRFLKIWALGARHQGSVLRGEAAKPGAGPNLPGSTRLNQKLTVQWDGRSPSDPDPKERERREPELSNETGIYLVQALRISLSFHIIKQS